MIVDNWGVFESCPTMSYNNVHVDMNICFCYLSLRVLPVAEPRAGLSHDPQNECGGTIDLLTPCIASFCACMDSTLLRFRNACSAS